MSTRVPYARTAARITSRCATAFIAAIACTALVACASDSDVNDSAAATTDSTGAGQSASVPPLTIPSAFTASEGRSVYDARRAFDLTGDDRPETIVLHAEGPRPDSAQVVLLVLTTTGDTIYRDGWNTHTYFQYEYRNTFSDSAAVAKVVQHLTRVLADSALTENGPPPRMMQSTPGGIDRDAVRYDLKESAVRAAHSIRPGTPLNAAQYAEMEKQPVTDAAIDSFVNDVKTSPTFMYYAGGEATYAIAWSKARNRFIRIFSCC